MGETLVLPPDRFSDAYAEADARFAGEGRGAEADAIRGLLAGSCSGWSIEPTSLEFYEAARAEQPTERQEVILGVLISEGSNDTVALAYLQGAFTWRQLARAMAGGGGTAAGWPGT